MTQQGDNHEKDRSGLRKATAGREEKACMFSYKASPEQLCAYSEGTVQKIAKEIIMVTETYLMRSQFCHLSKMMIKR